ncbi:DUF1716-domain-containing protein [Serendipita vermifera]|nr:DUF1716-domain-containing protein [Serendipita vermifera]
MDMFKVPKVPPTQLKRKLSDSVSPDNAKRHKPSPMEFMQSNASTSIKGKGKPTMTVEDAPDEEESTSEPQEEFAPGNDADYFAEEDEDGRFFGGGLTKEQKDILSIFEGAEGEGAVQELEELSLPAIRRLLLKLERAIDKNQDQRSKYPDDPTKFINSEADLDAAIKSLLPLSQVPTLAYPELVKSETIAMLIGLLSHENMDIVIDVVELIHELTDEDVGGEDEDDDEGGEENKRDASMKMLTDTLAGHSLLELLVQNFGRFNEEEDSDRQGLFHVLGIFENMLALNPSLSRKIVAETTFLQWLLSRIQAKRHDENRGYAAELLSILLQSDRDNRLAFSQQNGMETVLQVLSNYRKKDPETADEEEFMENLFDALCSALQEPENKQSFNDSEGVDLMLIMMREKLMAGTRAPKVLDNALSGAAGAKNCQVFVEAAGLKPLFTAFMGKSRKKKDQAVTPASEEMSHLLGIISSLFTNLDSESPERLRLLTKFVEGEYEKVDRLLDVRENAETRLKAAEKEIEAERHDLLQPGEEAGLDMENLWYLARLEGGLFTLQTVDYILGWICMEDDGIREHVSFMLGRRSQSLADLVRILKIYRDNVGDDDDMDESSESNSKKAILNGLLGFLEGSI